MQLSLEVFILINLLCGHQQLEVRMPAGTAWRERVTDAASHFVRRGVCAIVDDAIDTGMRDRIAGLILNCH